MTIAFARARNTISLSLSLCCVSISSTLRSSLSLHCCVHPFTPEDLTPARVFTSCVSSPDATRIPTIGAHKHSAGKAARLAAEPAHPHQRALRDADLGALPKAKVKVNGGTNVKVTVMSGGRERGELGWQKQRGSRHAGTYALTRFALGAISHVGTPRARGDRFEAATQPGARVAIEPRASVIHITAEPAERGHAPRGMLPLDAEIPLEIVDPASVHVSGNTLAFITTRPARFYTPSPHARRRATERDFVFAPGPRESTPGRGVEEMRSGGYIILEGHAGPLGVCADAHAVPVACWRAWSLEVEGAERLREGIMRWIEGERRKACAGGRSIHTGGVGEEILSNEHVGHSNGTQDTNGHSNGHANGYTNGHSNRSNGHTNGHANERANHSNGHVNGSSKERNGQTNSNGNSHIQSNCGSPLAGVSAVAGPSKTSWTDIPALLSKLDFTPRYLLEGLLASGALAPSGLPRVLRALPSSASMQERVLASIASTSRRTSGIDIAETITSRSYLRKRRVRAEAHQAIVYAAQVTPTGVRLGPPAPERASDALRALGDRLLCVTFTDEDGRPLELEEEEGEGGEAQGLRARVRRTLMFGLDISGRRYTFLAAEARSLTAWFASGDAAEARAVLGLDAISDRVVAAHTAKTSIPFTPSYPVSIEPIVRSLPDLHGKGGGTFTAGAGRCGEGIARVAARAAGLDLVKGDNTPSPDPPSALIVQAGGITGVLTVHPISDRDVALRPSQTAYTTPHTTLQFGLNAVRVARACPGELSHTTLLLLRHLGVPEGTIEARARDALALICSRAGRLSNGLPTEDDLRAAETCFPLASLVGAGFGPGTAVTAAARVLEARALARLRWDAPVDIKQAATLMAVPDEAGVLEPGQVFCQVGGRVLTGRCALMRPDTMHPGQVEVVVAVDRAELRHLADVVVFPVRSAKRSSPLHEMLGGALGDDYLLIWDRDLLPRRADAPLPYVRRQAPPVIRITDEHVQEWFTTYMAKDVRHKIRAAHLAHADRDGPASAICESLAIEARAADDYATSKDYVALLLTPAGVPASHGSAPRHWPTFMDALDAPPGAARYDSLEILGKLFTMTSTLGVMDAIAAGAAPCASTDTVPDPRLAAYTVPPSVHADADDLKRDYDDALRAIMAAHGVSEAEIMCGVRVRMRAALPGDEEDEDRMREAYCALVANTRTHAERFLFKRVFKARLTPIQIYALAAYHATVAERAECAREGEAGEAGEVGEAGDVLVSFPWVFSAALTSIPNVTSIET